MKEKEKEAEKALVYMVGRGFGKVPVENLPKNNTQYLLEPEETLMMKKLLWILLGTIIGFALGFGISSGVGFITADPEAKETATIGTTGAQVLIGLIVGAVFGAITWKFIVPKLQNRQFLLILRTVDDQGNFTEKDDCKFEPQFSDPQRLDRLFEDFSFDKSAIEKLDKRIADEGWGDTWPYQILEKPKFSSPRDLYRYAHDPPSKHLGRTDWRTKKEPGTGEGLGSGTKIAIGGFATFILLFIFGFALTSNNEVVSNTEDSNTEAVEAPATPTPYFSTFREDS